MPWLLLVLIFAVWCVWAVAAAARRHIADARRGVPAGERGGVSVFPVIPLFPLILWGLALKIDDSSSPWGTVTIGSAHALFAAFLVVSIVRDLWRLRSLNRHT